MTSAPHLFRALADRTLLRIVNLLAHSDEIRARVTALIQGRGWNKT